MGKRVFLAVVGASPQVVTETLYAFRQEGNFWPDEIVVLTTALGRKRVLETLIEPAGNSYLDKLVSELGTSRPEFTAEHVRVVSDSSGRGLDDVRNRREHEELADFIMHEVRHCIETSDQVYASLAGGRKTMTFFLGYAMSLFARYQDRLSHVLVSQGYEGRPDFFFPTRDHCPLAASPGDPEGVQYDASQATVELADIPFFRQRSNLDAMLSVHSLEAYSYRTLTRLINLGEAPARIHVRIRVEHQDFLISEIEGETVCSVKLSSGMHTALYALMAKASLNDDLNYPRTEMEKLSRDVLLSLYNTMGITPEKSALTSQDLARDLQKNDAHLRYLDSHMLRSQLLDTLADGGFDESTFDNWKNTILVSLNRQLPKNLANALAIHRVKISDDKGRPLSAYQLTLPEPHRQIIVE